MAKAKRSRAKVNIPICLAGVLLCLTLFSIHLTGGIFARYTTTASSSDSARVIRFGQLSLALTGGDTPQYIAPGVELEWNAAVTFAGSESATYVFLEVEGAAAGDADGVAPFTNGPEWAVATGWKYLAGTDLVYYRELEPNQNLAGVKLFSSDTAVVSEDLTVEQIKTIVPVYPVCRASVVQSNGFETPADAWASLESKHP